MSSRRKGNNQYGGIIGKKPPLIRNVKYVAMPRNQQIQPAAQPAAQPQDRGIANVRELGPPPNAAQRAEAAAWAAEYERKKAENAARALQPQPKRGFWEEWGGGRSGRSRKSRRTNRQKRTRRHRSRRHR